MDAVKAGFATFIQQAVENAVAETNAKTSDDAKVVRVSQLITRVRIKTQDNNGPRYFTVTVKEEM